ncbi:FkbM family methyltransferase [Planktothrix sp. FACHB-1355]|uniref:FkbM family methyltransferase n=1 Tax=Aerosakkonema funiforme FACHB-1375 TaxID=2949571 RepID=A0A926ZG34_9CYAN|nr:MULTISPECIES: FkbM family methyltransferase [Oscillatoriales]MBD2181535.1 FkbM family methyltransferase [Aerosakkonema funiforme FACHB-1375]MBD3560117.1 FkbM family methyltransferase [Planktothrix sp. FACHB-1355]
MIKTSRLKKWLKRSRRRLYEFWGSDRYSRPASSGIDSKLEKYLPNRGFFIEVGANDGFSQSNTYYLERLKGWTGILIEPIPELYRECVRERPNSKVFNCALVAHDYPSATIEMSYGHLMSLVKGSFHSSQAEAGHLEKAKEYYDIEPFVIEVPARTLTSILDELKVTEINFFSLDVEGFELNVLQGLEFSKYQPKYMLIEFLNVQSREAIEAYISKSYEYVEKISKNDYLYRNKR